MHAKRIAPSFSKTKRAQISGYVAQIRTNYALNDDALLGLKLGWWPLSDTGEPLLKIKISQKLSVHKLRDMWHKYAQIAY